MREHYLQTLHNIALPASLATIDRRTSLSPVEVKDLVLPLSDLARTARGVTSVTAEEILLTFYTPEAAQYLLTMPNIHWFWKVVKETALEGRWIPADLISLEVVMNTVRMMRRGCEDKYDLNKPLSELTPGQAASRAARGLVLIVHRPGDHDEIVHNPLFAPAN